MTNAFPMLLLLSTVTTNWVNFPGDLHRENGTNKVHQYQVIVTNTQWVEVKLCTNVIASFKTQDGTNGVTRWVEAQALLTPLPLPGQFTKP